jgi:cytochrome oxidase Cu insertion factor (SCO1/SenC/PrrC family)
MRLLVPFLAVLALAACGSEQASTPTTSGPPVEGGPVAGPGLDGERVSLADFRGKPVFVNVWSSW